MRALLALTLLATPAFALDGGAPMKPDQALSRAAVAIQAVSPQADGTARLSECSGVLIAQNLVLTAAHCLDEADKPQHVAVFFFDGAKAVPQFAQVSAIVRHPNYVRGWSKKAGDIETRQAEISADIAVLRLAAPAPAGRAPVGFDPASKPDVLTLAASGKAGTGGKSGTLKSTGLAAIRHTRTGPELAFATPGKGQVCTGDSGGAVVTASGLIWGVAGAILRGAGGCSARMVVVPVDPADSGTAELLRRAQAR